MRIITSADTSSRCTIAHHTQTVMFLSRVLVDVLLSTAAGSRATTFPLAVAVVVSVPSLRVKLLRGNVAGIRTAIVVHEVMPTRGGLLATFLF